MVPRKAALLCAQHNMQRLSTAVPQADSPAQTLVLRQACQARSTARSHVAAGLAKSHVTAGLASSRPCSAQHGRAVPQSGDEPTVQLTHICWASLPGFAQLQGGTLLLVLQTGGPGSSTLHFVRAHRLAVCTRGACGIDVQKHGLGAIPVLEVQQLCDDELCDCRDQLQKGRGL